MKKNEQKYAMQKVKHLFIVCSKNIQCIWQYNITASGVFFSPFQMTFCLLKLEEDFIKQIFN